MDRYDVKGTSSNMDVRERRVMMLKFTVFIFFLIRVNGQNPEQNVDKPIGNIKPTQNAIPIKPGAKTVFNNPQSQNADRGAKQPAPGKPAAMRLVESKECGNEIIKLCNPKIYKNNFAILDCLQNDIKVSY